MENWWNIFLNRPIAEPNLLFFLMPLIFVVGFRWADRFWGADGKKKTGKLITGALAAIAWFLLGPYGTLAVLLWALYRSLSFKGGAAAPVDGKELNNAFRRHFVVVPLMILPTLGFVGLSNLLALAITIGLFSAYAYVAYKGAESYGLALIDARANGTSLGKFNMKLELARGTAFGGTFAVYCLLFLFHI